MNELIIESITFVFGQPIVMKSLVVPITVLVSVVGVLHTLSNWGRYY